ncbi:RNA polymerase subunit (RPO35) [Eptesipox virus]|uniref:DNA-directed RNA polymerase 35 kDa subunit n=1 Tax=Eptesipox virus TaxID=1329402 RepID=A0A220T6J3_9POXV|nr:RNA polymerase subunit (RPO35) [Eptesipox virus]ASK51327.1 RNA polymerase subunit (RPO35) [Eptesipox virus]WAH71085.1 RNA polymerase subunit RPO35 [Eptesipox virus]
MFKKDKIITVELDASLASFIKHGFNNHVKWPLLNIATVLDNTTTAVNEEWLTSIEHLPTKKIFYDYTSQILRNEVKFCIYLKSEQSHEKKFITLYDIDYYIIDESGAFIKINKPNELKETLLHTYQEYKLKNQQNIELIAFSSGTNINEDIVDKLTFLNIEVFNKEYANIKPILSPNFMYNIPIIVTAPQGKLTFYIETYSWFDYKSFLIDVLNYLEGVLVADIHNHKIEVTNIDNNNVSSYNSVSGILYVKDLVTMCIVNFFGCKCRLNSYHRFDMSKVDIEIFLKALSDAFIKISKQI